MTDVGEGLPGGDAVSLLGEVDEHDVSQRALGIVGQADGEDAILLQNPLMGLAVLQVCGNVRHDFFLHFLFSDKL